VANDLLISFEKHRIKNTPTPKQYSFIAISIISSTVNMQIIPVLIPNIRPFNARNIMLEADNKPHDIAKTLRFVLIAKASKADVITIQKSANGND